MLPAECTHSCCSTGRGCWLLKSRACRAKQQGKRTQEQQQQEQQQAALDFVCQAYSLSPDQPGVLNLLAAHTLAQGDYAQVCALSWPILISGLLPRSCLALQVSLLPHEGVWHLTLGHCCRPKL